MAVVFLYPATGVSTTDEDGNPFPSTGLRVSMNAFYEERCRDGLLVRSDPSATNVLAQPAVYAPYTLSLVTTQLATYRLYRDARYVTTSGYATPGDEGGGTFYGALGVSSGADSYTKINASDGQWQLLEGTAGVNVCQFGAKGDSNGTVGNGTDNTAAINAAILYSSGGVFFPDGTYRHAGPIVVDANRSFSCRSRDSAVLVYDGLVAQGGAVNYSGSDYAWEVNGTHLTPYPHADARFDVTRMSISNLRIKAVNSHGICFGCTINPSILLSEVTITDCAGYAIDCGDSTYFLTLAKCLIQRSRGVNLRSSCDQFTARDTQFWYNRDYDVHLRTPTFCLDNTDHELNSGDNGNKAFLLIPTANWATGYGTITNSRFGDEAQAAMVQYDIYLQHGVGLTPPADVAPLGGVHILNTKHFGPTSLGLRISPILTDVGLTAFQMSGAIVNTNYTSPYQITTLSGTGVTTGSSVGQNYVDRLDFVAPEIRGIFNTTGDRPGILQAMAAQSMGPSSCVYDVFFESTPSYGIPGTRKVALASASPVDFVRNLSGITQATCATDTFTTIAGHGAMVLTTLNTIGLPVMTPVYYAAGGGISLTPTSPTRVIGWTMTTAAAAWIRIDLTQPTLYAAQPNAGTWVAGELALNNAPSVSNGIELIGWKRKTTGSAHVAGTDWDEVYTSTNVGGAYTPTFSTSLGGGALNNGTIAGHYSVKGREATVSVTMTAGAGTTFGAGAGNQLRWSLPAGVAPAGTVVVGSGSVLDASLGTYATVSKCEANATYFLLISDAGVYVSDVLPVAWAVGDIFRMSVTFVV